MNVTFNCPECQQTCSVNADLAALPSQCEHCRASITVPVNAPNAEQHTESPLHPALTGESRHKQPVTIGDAIIGALTAVVLLLGAAKCVVGWCAERNRPNHGVVRPQKGHSASRTFMNQLMQEADQVRPQADAFLNAIRTNDLQSAYSMGSRSYKEGRTEADFADSIRNQPGRKCPATYKTSVSSAGRDSTTSHDFYYSVKDEDDRVLDLSVSVVWEDGAWKVERLEVNPGR